MTFGSTIREARERLGWTQKALAERIGVTPGFITKLENDQALPSLDLVLALANALLVDRDTLLELCNRARQERAGQRIRTRGSAASAILTGGEEEGTLPERARGAPEMKNTAEQLGQAILGDEELRLAFSYLRDALADPELKEAVLKSLEAFARLAVPQHSPDELPSRRGRSRKPGK
jgi:transcriptional regulator with XRE-family HTH domain